MNIDLHMSIGKVFYLNFMKKVFNSNKTASQCSHATLAIYKLILYSTNPKVKAQLNQWESEGEPTIVVKLPG